MSPVPYTWGPFLAKIFLKIDEIKIRPLTPPQNHFNTLPVLVADACIQEGWEKRGVYTSSIFQKKKKESNTSVMLHNLFPVSSTQFFVLHSEGASRPTKNESPFFLFFIS